MLRFAFIALLGLSACAETPVSPSVEPLSGVWRVISIQPAGQPVQPAPVGAQYQVAFGNDRVVARVDCNTCTGEFIASGTSVAIGPTLACTRAACETAAYENAVVSMLSGVHEITSTLHNLTLTSNRGTMLLQR
jgi:heat shock protein HslJ